MTPASFPVSPLFCVHLLWAFSNAKNDAGVISRTALLNKPDHEENFIIYGGRYG